jgi:glycosyltransferase involved in cell wall biosynthesis
MERNRGLRLVALLTVRNEELYLPRCLEHLYQQGIETCIVDNESTDDTLRIANSFVGRGIIRMESQPYRGFFDLTEQLYVKEQLAAEIEADWFMHCDADEIREAPEPRLNLREAIEVVDSKGYNAVNFDEFVFLPTSETEAFEGTDYVETMRYYYFFQPEPLRQVKAWRASHKKINLTGTGGHRVDFSDRRVYPKNFILRHYIGLSKEHIIRKYFMERIYSEYEVQEKGWHGSRATFSPHRLTLPNRGLLKCLDSDGWDKSQPWKTHTFLG